MSRRISFTLSADELLAVEEAMHHSQQAEVRQRATAIRLLHLGHKPEAVAQMFAVAASTIWNWHRRFRASGLAGLTNLAKSGRPAKATGTYLDAVAQALASEPRTLGYPFSVWTINKLRHHLEQETGILLSYSRMRALLRKHDYVHRQPKHDLSELKDEQAKAQAKERLEWLKKSPATTPSSSLWTKRA